MHGHHQLQAGVVEGELLAELAHHSWARPHQGDAPLMLGGMGQQVMGELNARAAAHPNALAPQGPTTPAPSGITRSAARIAAPVWLGECRHRHLGIEGDQLPAAIAVQFHSGREHIRANVDRHPEHLLAVTGAGG